MDGSPRIAIVGGGVAGLTCLHVLRSGGADVRLFEAESRPGGRIRTYRDPQGRGDVELGAAYFHRYYRATRLLVRSIGLQGRVLRRHPRGLAFIDARALSEGSAVPIALDRAGLWRAAVRRQLGVRDMIALARLGRAARSASRQAVRDILALQRRNDPGTAEPASPYATLLDAPWYAEAVSRPFGTMLADLSPTIAELVRATCRKQIFQSADELDLATGQFLAASLAVPQYTLAGGMDQLTDRLAALHQPCLHLATPVQAVHPDGQRWVVRHGRGEEVFDAVVLAMPWPHLRRLLPPASVTVPHPARRPGLSAEPVAADARVLVVAGDLRERYAAHDVLYLLGGSAGLSGLSRYGRLWKIGVPAGVGEPALLGALDALYVGYDVVHDQRWTPGMPMRHAGAPVGEGEVASGLFVVGDHAVPCLELAVRSGAWAGQVLVRRMMRGRRGNALWPPGAHGSSRTRFACGSADA